MESDALKISLRMAVVMGILLPLAETLRRSNQLLDPARFLNWFDDYLLGGAMLLAAYGVKRKKPNAVSWLIGVWGIGVGALFLSFIGQFEYYETAAGDPGIFSTTLVAVIKGLILIYMFVGLRLSIKANESGSI
jgi:peptidoglycan/LPS O-acetylase OafA/YrhL